MIVTSNNTCRSVHSALTEAQNIYLTWSKKIARSKCGRVVDMRSETSSLKIENELALHRTDIRVIRWMYGVRLRDKISCVDLRQRTEIEDMVKASKLQRNILRGYDGTCSKK